MIATAVHPLQIRIATAREGKAGGQGMMVVWGIAESPFGKCFIARTPHGISHLSFFDGDEAESLEALEQDFPKASRRRDDKLAASIIARLFRGQSGNGEPIPLHLGGTEFQLKVWKALVAIPVGETTTYGRLAKQIGMEGAARAVGNAVGRNRIAWLIPCHRVVRENGDLGGYRWGTERKRAMIFSERQLIPR